jgi:hypothetical protein
MSHGTEIPYCRIRLLSSLGGGKQHGGKQCVLELVENGTTTHVSVGCEKIEIYGEKIRETFNIFLTRERSGVLQKDGSRSPLAPLQEALIDDFFAYYFRPLRHPDDAESKKEVPCYQFIIHRDPERCRNYIENGIFYEKRPEEFLPSKRHGGGPQKTCALH